MSPLWITILLGGVAALDATPVAQTLLSQPLVTGTLLAALWGDWRTGLEVAIVFQVFAASTSPVGSRTPPDFAVGGVIGVGTALALGAARPFPFADDAAAMVGVMVGLLAAVLGTAPLRWQRRLNEGLARWCEDEVRRGNEKALGRAHAAAVFLAFAVGVGYTAACLGIALGSLQGLAGTESLRLARAWRLAEPLWLGLGLAQILHLFVQRRFSRVALFGAALVGAWVWLLVGSQ